MVCAKADLTLPFWSPMQMVGLSEAEGREVRNKLVDSSVLRMVDRDRQRFQLHGLIREQLRNMAPVRKLQAAHVETLECLFRYWWEERWIEFRECMSEVIPALWHLWRKNESSRAKWLSYCGFAAAKRIGEFESSFRIVQQAEALCLELDNRSGLAYCYWNWGLLPREQGDHGTERQKLDAALDIFTQLNMLRERDEVRAELEKATAPD
jgi:hypothetical protein